MKVHHIGYAVSDIDKAAKAFLLLDYKIQSNAVDDFDRNVKILFLNNNDVLIELISILDKTKASPIDYLFKKRFAFPGNGIPYHICYNVVNIEKTISELAKKRFILINPPAKAPALNNNDVAFLYHKDIGIIELLQNNIHGDN